MSTCILADHFLPYLGCGNAFLLGHRVLWAPKNAAGWNEIRLESKKLILFIFFSFFFFSFSLFTGILNTTSNRPQCVSKLCMFSISIAMKWHCISPVSPAWKKKGRPPGGICVAGCCNTGSSCSNDGAVSSCWMRSKPRTSCGYLSRKLAVWMMASICCSRLLPLKDGHIQHVGYITDQAAFLTTQLSLNQGTSLWVVQSTTTYSKLTLWGDACSKHDYSHVEQRKSSTPYT